MRILTTVNTALLTAVVLVTAVLFTGTSTASPLEPAPISDPLYVTPANLGSFKPGDIIASRPMPPPSLFFNVDVWQLQFRSTNSAGDPIAAVTTVMAAKGKAPNGPLLSYQTIINALGLKCAPSQTLYTTDPDLFVREAPALNVFLQRGWTIAIPDHLGPDSAYGAAKLGGRIVLDGVRAAQRFDPLQVSGSPVALAGYSGGGMATAWAAALQAEYAPELNIVGSAAGGAPMNLAEMAEGIGFGATPLFGLAFAAALGLEREYPTRIPVSEQLNPLGLDLRNKIANSCTNDIIRLGAGLSADQVASTKNLLGSASAREAVDENSVELYAGVPKAPYFEWHSPTDALIPVPAIDRTIARYCASGVKVEQVLAPSNDHLTAAVLGLPAALDWINNRFMGQPAPTTCR